MKKTWLGLLLILLIAYTSEAQPVVPVVPQGGNPPICSTNPDPPTAVIPFTCCIVGSGNLYCGDSGGAATSQGSGLLIGEIADLTDVATDADAQDDEILLGDDTDYRGVILPTCDQGDEKLHYNSSTNSFSCVADANTGTAPLTPGADADSSTTNSPSGLEIVSGFLTVLRGCSNLGTIEWNETLDRWECTNRYRFGNASPATPVHIGSVDGTSGWDIGVDTPGPFLNCVDNGQPCNVVWQVATNKTMEWELENATEFTLTHTGDVTLGQLMEEVKWAEIPAAMFEEDATHCVYNEDAALNGAKEQTVTCPDSGGTDAARFFVKFNAPPAWDEAQIRLRFTLFQSDATPDGNMALDLSLECVGHGEEWPGTQGAITNLDFAVSTVAQNRLVVATSGDLSGVACDPGDRVRARVQIDDDVTTAATPQSLHFLSVDVLLNFNTWSN